LASDTTTVHVALSERSYDIDIGRGLLPDAGRFVLEHAACSHAVVITDSNVGPLHGQRVVESLEQTGVRVDIATVPAGEATKSAAPC